MPREVIMPALGMAQDTGRIVAWLKSAGDPVKAGDALFEVETDKATMEVEAAQDGFLSQPRYEAGQDVPVGEVIAVIAASADEARSAAPDPGSEVQESAVAPSADAPDGDDLPPGRDIIMPALGMAQDSGRIVAWHKSPGDSVQAADILFEVETDKATMEVEAGHDGYLAATLGHEGEDVPVGRPVAIISDAPPDTPIARSAAQAPAASADSAAPADAGAAAQAAGAPLPGPAATTPPASAPDGRILASPKARRLARERGLDLSRLVRMGVAQPFHVADLETLANAPPETETEAAAVAAAPAAARCEITATAPAAPLSDLIEWARGDTGAAPPRAGVLAAFAAAALRAAQDTDAPLVIRSGDLHGTALYTDPDLAGFGALTDAQTGDDDGEAAATLSVRDLAATPLTGARLAQAARIELSVTAGGEDMLALQLSCEPAALSDGAALALLDGVARRLADPLRQLL